MNPNPDFLWKLKHSLLSDSGCSSLKVNDNKALRRPDNQTLKNNIH